MSRHGVGEILAPNHCVDRSLDIEAAGILPGEYDGTGRDMLPVTVPGARLAAEDLMGRDPRKVRFVPAGGRFVVRRFKSAHIIVQREMHCGQRPGNSPFAGKPERFS